MISTIITAGGVSRRFGSNKLLELMDDKTVIEHTILKFLKYSDEIVIPCADETKEIILNSKAFNKEKIKFVPFGQTRQKSVYNGLLGCTYKDFVLIHDGARPFIEEETIKEAIELVKVKKAVCVGSWAVDTIKMTDKEGKIVNTLDRNFIFQAQTPQAFEYELILSAHKKFCDKDNFTDDSSMVEALGCDVFALASLGVNRKITTRADL